MSRSAFKTLVSSKWLSDKLASGPKNFRIIDASLHKPATKRDPLKEYKERHIPTAQFFDVEGCSDKTSKYDNMLPSAAQFAEYVGGLGIDNDTHVVIYDTSEYTFYSAPRVWWMFAVFGHTNVSLLEGGINQWMKEGYETTAVTEEVEKVKFTPVHHADMVATFEDIEKNLTEKAAIVVDARSAGRFGGTAPEPRPDIKPGHIRGTVNIPFPTTMDLEAMKMKSPEELKMIFEEAGIDFTQPVITTCGSGVTACTLVLCAQMLGHSNVPMYDGSWVEWYMRAKEDDKVDIPM